MTAARLLYAGTAARPSASPCWICRYHHLRQKGPSGSPPIVTGQATVETRDTHMSEFQYYEFQAIDRPLDEEAQRALRRISTRALITPHSLVNTYQWGDFKGKPRDLVARWFDLF